VWVSYRLSGFYMQKFVSSYSRFFLAKSIHLGDILKIGWNENFEKGPSNIIIQRKLPDISENWKVFEIEGKTSCHYNFSQIGLFLSRRLTGVFLSKKIFLKLLNRVSICSKLLSSKFFFSPVKFFLSLVVKGIENFV